MRLAKVQKTPNERRRYTVDYRQWLDTNELITDRSFTVTPSGALEVDQSSVSDGNNIIMFLDGGVDGVTYEVTIIATTSIGQIKEDTLVVLVKDS